MVYRVCNASLYDWLSRLLVSSSSALFSRLGVEPGVMEGVPMGVPGVMEGVPRGVVVGVVALRLGTPCVIDP